MRRPIVALVLLLLSAGAAPIGDNVVRIGSLATTNGKDAGDASGVVPPTTISVVLPPAAAPGAVQSDLEVKVPAALAGKAVRLLDHPSGARSDHPISVTFTPENGQGLTGTSRFFVARITGLSSGFASMTRKLIVQVDGYLDTVSDYSITEAASTPGQFTLSLWPGQVPWDQATAGIPVMFRVTSSQLTGLAVVTQPFQDDGSKHLLPSFRLCAAMGTEVLVSGSPLIANSDAEDETGAALASPSSRGDTSSCSAVKTLPHPGVYPMRLVAEGPRPPAGSYKGQVQVAADGASLTNPSQMTITVTTLGLQLLGCLALAGGVLVAFVMNQVLPIRAARLDGLRPLAVLSDGISDLITGLAAYPQCFTPANMPILTKAVADLDRDRRLSAFDAVAGGSGFFARFFPGETAANAETVKTYLDGLGRRLNAFSIIAGQGLARIEPVYATAVAAATTAIGRIDGIVAGAPNQTPAGLTTQVAGFVSEMETAIKANPAAAIGLAVVVPPAAKPPSVRRVDLELNVLNGLGWLVWAILTILVGSMVQVFGHPDFGSPLDFILCVLWGFGLPAAGSALSTVSASTIRSSIQIPFK